MISVEITAGPYLIFPYVHPNGQVFIRIQRVEDMDAHDHPVGSDVTVNLEELFKGRKGVT